MEKFKKIPNHEKYSISEDGIVIGQKGVLNQYNGKRGYKNVYLYKGGGKRNCMSVHRLVMLTYAPNANSDSLTVNHKDGDKKNNNLNNLEWMTNAENIRHSFTAGIRKRESMGRKLGKTYAIPKQILIESFSLIKSGKSIRATAKFFNVGHATLQYQFNKNKHLYP